MSQDKTDDLAVPVVVVGKSLSRAGPHLVRFGQLRTVWAVRDGVSVRSGQLVLACLYQSAPCCTGPNRACAVFWTATGAVRPQRTGPRLFAVRAVALFRLCLWLCRTMCGRQCVQYWYSVCSGGTGPHLFGSGLDWDGWVGGTTLSLFLWCWGGLGLR